MALAFPARRSAGQSRRFEGDERGPARGASAGGPDAGHGSRRARPGENPFLPAQRPAGGGGDDETFTLEVEFAVADVNFFSQLGGELQNATPLEVVAEGAGTTAEAALRDALREAVRHAIERLADAGAPGRFVEQVDREAAAAEQLVLSYRELSQEVQKGIHRVRLSAVVDREKLAARLRKAGVPLSDN